MFSLWAARPAGGGQGARPGSRTPLPAATAGVTLCTRMQQCSYSQVRAHTGTVHTLTHTHLRTRTPTLSRALGSRQPLPSGEALWPRTAVVGTAWEGAVEGRAGSDGALGAQSR